MRGGKGGRGGEGKWKEGGEGRRGKPGMKERVFGGKERIGQREGK